MVKIPATYMRGGTSKGVFFHLDDLPAAAQVPGTARDNLLLRVIGSPDPYGKQIDGLGGGTSSTSKVVIVSKSSQPDHDVDYLFGQVAINEAMIDWGGNCGNLTAAVGAFAISHALVPSVPEHGLAKVRIWQANIGKTIIAHVPVMGGTVQESGDFVLDGVAFAAAEIKLEFLDPAGSSDVLFPTGQLVDQLAVPGVGTLSATLINAGIPTIFVHATAVGYAGTELQQTVNNDPQALALFEQIRASGALRMGLINKLTEAGARPHVPKVAYIAPPAAYVSAGGREIPAQEIDLLVRALSMGQLHHAMMGTAAVAIAAAAAIPGTLVSQVCGPCNPVRCGHPSGILSSGAQVRQDNGRWSVARVTMSRSARVLMEGTVRVPAA